MKIIQQTTASVKHMKKMKEFDVSKYQPVLNELEKQVAGCNSILIRVGKSHIINKNRILQINIPKQKLILLTQDEKPRELVDISKDPLKALKNTLEEEMMKGEEALKNAAE